MTKKNVGWFILTLVAVFVISCILGKACYYQRGYWAVGGEMFIPMILLGWGVYNLLKGEGH